jgi:predicted site-specific integrase-resolvase
MQELLTIKEVAKIVGVNTRTILMWDEKGKERLKRQKGMRKVGGYMITMTLKS